MAMRDKLLEQMKALAESYVPEWSFRPEEPDAGSVVALLYKDMLQGSIERYERVLHKHKIQYLNMFDRFKEEPVEAAKSFVQFIPVTGAPQPVHIPRGTRLFAESDKTDQQVVFETTHGLTVTPTELTAIFTTDGKNGTITQQFSRENQGGAESCSFTAFRTGGNNLEEHVLFLGFSHTFDHLESLELDLLISTSSEEELAGVLEVLSSADIVFSVLCADGFEAFDKITVDNERLHLYKEHFFPQKAVIAGRDCCQIALTAQKAHDIRISGAKISFAKENILPDDIRCGGISQNIGHFHPFGFPMEIYASCEMESKTVFARKGAKVNLSFSLDFDILEQLLPEYEVEEEYRVIMRSRTNQPKLSVADVHADYVLLEYLSETGWKRLLYEEHAALLFAGNARGDVALSFTMPGDILSAEVAADQPRLRFRLMRAEGLYRLPCRLYCPVIDDLRFSYSYEDAPQSPDCVVSRNNFEQIDATGHLDSARSITPFYTRESDAPAIYLGFDTNPWGTPTSLYLRLENDADYHVDFTVQYLSPAGFLPLKAVDNTAGFLSSGALHMAIPQDADHKNLFGQDLYWLRLINHNKDEKHYNLPQITGLYLNMAKVENVRTQTETFYIDNIEGSVHITLGGQGLIAAQVYINEENSRDGENWVLWQQRRHREDRGRCYDIDMATGRVQFEKSVFAVYPIKEDGPSIKVVFQTYHGSGANVDAGHISSLASSIRYISAVHNPMPAYGGYDGFNEKTSAAIISNMLRTRGRAVSQQDFCDIISQVSYGVRRVKCLRGVNLKGEAQDGAVTIAILIDEYEKGGHIFSGAKEAIREKLLACSSIIPEGKELTLTQPRFVRMSTRLWLVCEKMENAYDLQNECSHSIYTFIDPLTGGFDGTGWEIGVLPTATQLVAYLKIKHPDVVVSKIVMSATFENREFAVDDQINRHIASPFAMAVNSEHTVYTQLMEE